MKIRAQVVFSAKNMEAVALLVDTKTGWRVEVTHMKDQLFERQQLHDARVAYKEAVRALTIAYSTWEL